MIACLHVQSAFKTVQTYAWEGDRKKYLLLSVITIFALGILTSGICGHFKVPYFEPRLALTRTGIGASFLCIEACSIGLFLCYNKQFIPFEVTTNENLNQKLRNNEYYLGYTAHRNKSFYFKGSSAHGVKCKKYTLEAVQEVTLENYTRVTLKELRKRT